MKTFITSTLLALLFPFLAHAGSEYTIIFDKAFVEKYENRGLRIKQVCDAKQQSTTLNYSSHIIIDPDRTKYTFTTSKCKKKSKMPRRQVKRFHILFGDNGNCTIPVNAKKNSSVKRTIHYNQTDCVDAMASNKFSIVVMSDPQYNWSCDSENAAENKKSDYCKSDSTDLKRSADETNNLHKNAIRAIRNDVNSNACETGHCFKGVIINGDLTSFGAQSEHLEKFSRNYNKLNVHLWIGLGNHDYDNPVDQCMLGVRNIQSNECAARMMQYMAEKIKKDKTVKNSNISKFKKNPFQAGEFKQRNIHGSLGYSWDIGHFHFVQLHNYPTYRRKFTRGFSKGVHSWTLLARRSIEKDGKLHEWLEEDLNSAKENDQAIILNWHQYHDTYNSVQKREPLIKALKPYKNHIKAIFVGHAHSKFGKLQTLSVEGVQIPVIYSGSAIYNRFIKADFYYRKEINKASEICTISTQVINTFTTDKENTSKNSNGGNGKYDINC